MNLLALSGTIIGYSADGEELSELSHYDLTDIVAKGHLEPLENMPKEVLTKLLKSEITWYLGDKGLYRVNGNIVLFRNIDSAWTTISIAELMTGGCHIITPAEAAAWELKHPLQILCKRDASSISSVYWLMNGSEGVMWHAPGPWNRISLSSVIYKDIQSLVELFKGNNKLEVLTLSEARNILHAAGIQCPYEIRSSKTPKSNTTTRNCPICLTEIKCAEQADHKELDGTDFAHPAYWRGHDDAVRGLCTKIEKILDGKEIGSGVSNEPWESTKKRLLSLAEWFFRCGIN